MMHKRQIMTLSFLFSATILLDQSLKYLARVNPEFTAYVWKPLIGWELYLNRGIAFSLPFPNWLIILITPTILLLLTAWLLKENNRPFLHQLALCLIIAGAVSNYADRVLFGATIDYLRVFTSVINFADVTIATGVILLFL